MQVCYSEMTLDLLCGVMCEKLQKWKFPLWLGGRSGRMIDGIAVFSSLSRCNAWYGKYQSN